MMAIEVKIKLTQDLPIDPSHECFAGKEFVGHYQNTYIDDKGNEQASVVRGKPIEFKGSSGDLCVAFSDEYQKLT
jgi:hypothetical protein